MIHDIINSVFELFAGLFLIMNIVKLYHDKKICGVCIAPTAFFTLWGYWNCFFYPAVDAWYSFGCGILVAIVNTVWVGQMFYYRAREQSDDNS